MAASTTFSDLEVASSAHISHSDLEVHSKNQRQHQPADLEVHSKHQRQHQPAGLEYNYYHSHQHLQTKDVAVISAADAYIERKRIAGLSPKSFWTILIVLVLIISIGAVGGGVGSSLASRASRAQRQSLVSNSTSTSGATLEGTGISPGLETVSTSRSTTDQQQTTLSTSASVTPSRTTSVPLATTTSVPLATTTSVPLATSTIITAKAVLLRDCPSSNNTLYSPPKKSDVQFRKICGQSYLNTDGFAAVVNIATTSLDNCIDLCADFNVRSAGAIAKGMEKMCNAVCWRNSLDGDDAPGKCYGYTTQNSTGNFVKNVEGKCDSAAWINQAFI